MASRPDSPGAPEIEAGDDFVLTSETAITHATFTGLVSTASFKPDSIQGITLEIYRVFPLDSNAARTPQVPTRSNSPSDLAFQSRTSSSGDLTFTTSLAAKSFTASNSVLNGIHPAPSQTTGGDGAVSGAEVQVSVAIDNAFDLPAGHYFFIPQVQLADGANFYWLSAPKPIVSPGTPFPAGNSDLQAWIRNSALDPDWLRVGTDIVGGTPAPTFNATFALDNAPLQFQQSTKPIKGSVGIRLSLRVPTKGVIRVFDPLVGRRGGHKRPWFNTITVRPAHGGVVQVKVVPNATGRAQLARHRTLHLSVEVTFAPPGGRPAVHVFRITWKRR